MPTVRELRTDRAKLIKQARDVNDKAGEEKRALTDDEQAMFARLMDEAQGLQDHFEQLERLEAVESDVDESQGNETGQRDTDDDRSSLGSRETRDQIAHREQADVRAEAFRSYLSGGERGMTETEYRALQADSATAGGFTVAVKFVTDLIKAIDDEIHIRQWATKLQVGRAESLGAPSLDADPEDATWTTEIKAADPDTQMEFGKRELTPHPAAKLLKIAMNLLATSAIDVEALVKDRLAYKFGVTQEKAFLTGSGAGQPLGVFVASDDGIPTGRDVSTGNTNTALTFDGLVSAKYALKGAYWAKARWMFHRDVVQAIAKLKDDNDQYIWRESVRTGEPDRILNMPIMMSEYAPSTFTSGLYLGILADWSNYWIADSTAMSVQRLSEHYAETHQIGFIGRMQLDGMPVLGEAFARVTLA